MEQIQEKDVEKILDSIKPMIISICNKWKPNQRITKEDLFQEGQKAAIEAIKKFDNTLRCEVSDLCV